MLSGEFEIKSHRSPSMGAGGDTGSRHQVSESRRDTPGHAISRAQVVPLWEKSATGCEVTANCIPVTSTRVQSMLLPVLGPCLGTVKRIPSRRPGKTHMGVSGLWNVPWLPHHKSICCLIQDKTKVSNSSPQWGLGIKKPETTLSA